MIIMDSDILEKQELNDRELSGFECERAARPDRKRVGL